MKVEPDRVVRTKSPSHLHVNEKISMKIICQDQKTKIINLNIIPFKVYESKIVRQISKICTLFIKFSLYL